MKENLSHVLQSGVALGKFLDSELAKLQKPTFVEIENTPSKRGIYVIFGKDEKPIYVGRTNNLKKRIKMHTNDYSNVGTATYAYNRAKNEYEKKHGKFKGTRIELEKNSDFKPLFKKEKEYLRKDCSYAVLLIDDSILQTIIEPYIACHLQTSNKFANH